MCLFLTACTKIVEVPIPVKTPIHIHKPTKIEPLNPREVNFQVVSTKEPSTYINDKSYVALTIKDYENLSLNLNDIIAYIKKQNAVIIYYENTADFYKDNK